MIAAVFADTHGNTARMLEAVRSLKPDALIHLGDYARDAEALRESFPELPLYVVRGNCDVVSSAPDTAVAELGGVRVFLAHGHQYGVDWGRLDSLVYAAMERKARVALYGHTHEANVEEIAAVQLMNPGTAGKGRKLSFGVLEIWPNGGVTTEIRDL